MLTEQLTADAAALHQAILRHGGEVSPFFCGKELGWEHRRIARAMEPWGSVWSSTQLMSFVHLLSGSVSTFLAFS